MEKHLDLRVEYGLNQHLAWRRVTSEKTETGFEISIFQKIRVSIAFRTVGRDGDKIWRPKAGLSNNADMSLGDVRGWEDAMQREKIAKFHLLGEKQKNQFVAKGRGMAV